MLGDKIVTLKLPSPLTVASGSSVRQVIDTVQQRQIGVVLICDGKRLIGIMTERDVLMKIVSRDVNHDEPVDKFMTANPRTLTSNGTIGEAISLMIDNDVRNVPIVDPATGDAIAVLRAWDVIHILAESFPEHVLNLPPKPHQKMKTAEGA